MTRNETLLDHPHPCNFRRNRHVDRGWGEIAFEYAWDSSSGCKEETTRENSDLGHCYLYERTDYAVEEGTESEGFFIPLDPPFVQWRFRNPTDGRTGPVGLECFAATQGWAWDRHKLPGKLAVPPQATSAYTILAVQQYRFHCELCGADEVVHGPDAGPHTILRTFAPKPPDIQNVSSALRGGCIWRYAITKHGVCAWMDWDPQGYVADSIGLRFGPI
jgi:hypothetical protein